MTEAEAWEALKEFFAALLDETGVGVRKGEIRFHDREASETYVIFSDRGLKGGTGKSPSIPLSQRGKIEEPVITPEQIEQIARAWMNAKAKSERIRNAIVSAEEVRELLSAAYGGETFGPPTLLTRPSGGEPMDAADVRKLMGRREASFYQGKRRGFVEGFICALALLGGFILFWITITGGF